MAAPAQALPRAAAPEAVRLLPRRGQALVVVAGVVSGGGGRGGGGGGGSVMWMTAEQGAAIKDWVNAGNGFYSMHNSGHDRMSNKDYRDVMGGGIISHPPLRPFPDPGDGEQAPDHGGHHSVHGQ